MTPIDPKRFFLGKNIDSSGSLTEDKLLYKPEDLNTHCVITGMTGSGKTGLGIALLEEVALKNIPAIIIDPKGDLTNLLLHFPDLRGDDFAPWIDPESPVREGKDIGELAEETAEKWRTGLNQWGFGQDEIEKLKNISYTLFTPGSTVGNPINIMSTFNPPEGLWKADDENIREEISTSVTALLDLVGISNIDPIQSREHILLSNIIEHYWNMGKSIDIEEMIHAINEPPFEKLGALPIDRMYPPKDRFALALLLNNFLASPSFQTWSKGPNLDVKTMLYTDDGRAKFNIFYIQHLSDHERMFFVTMLYSQIESWMRMQSGTGNLRLAVYFDEIAGYLPASSNPASRGIILRMLKQARAFGVSMILSSQNPIDFDYKALSNAGTWMIGHLQTEQDKNRLLDGLTTNAGQIDRNQANRLISSLKNRQFLYMNVHEPGLKIFTTRWVMNFLAGPLTRNQIPELFTLRLSEHYDGNAETNQSAESIQNNPETGEIEMAEKTNETAQVPDGTKPAIASIIAEYYRKVTKTPTEADAPNGNLTYMPVWFAQAETRIIQQKYSLDFIDFRAAMVEDDDVHPNSIRWGDYPIEPITRDMIEKKPAAEDAKFIAPPAWMLESGSSRTRESDFVDYVYRDGNIKIRANEALKIFASPTTSEDDFIQLCKSKIESASQVEKDKITKSYETLVDSLETKIRRAQADVEAKAQKVSSRNLEKFGAIGEFAISLLSGKRRSISTSINKFGMSNTAGSAFEKANMILEDLQKSLEKETDSYKTQIESLKARWEEIAEKSSEISVAPLKKDIFVDYFGILWLPYYTDSNGKLVKAF